MKSTKHYKRNLPSYMNENLQRITSEIYKKKFERNLQRFLNEVYEAYKRNMKKQRNLKDIYETNEGNLRKSTNEIYKGIRRIKRWSGL